MNAIETIPYKGLTIEIYPDDSPSDPRRERQYLGHMVCYHRDYVLGDEQVKRDEAVETFNERIKQAKGGIVLPLYVLDHSGLWMRTGTFREDSQGWDTSEVGIIYATAETLRKEYSVKRITKAIRQKAREVLEAEVSEYSDYLSGSVYGYVIKDERGEELDSCWGFIGDYTYAISEAKTSADYYATKRDVEALSVKQRVFAYAGVPS